MKIKAFAIGAILAGLAGCASNSVPLTGNESTVHFKAQIGDEMTAKRIDTKPVGNLKNFIFTGAKHTLEFGIVMAGHRDSHRRCLATLTYANFEPGAHYTLTQTNVIKGDIAVSLIDANGIVVAREDNIPCI